MTQSVQTQQAFPADVPPNLRCGFCGQPVQGHFYRAIDRFTCDRCVSQIQRATGQQPVAPDKFIAAGAAGLATALAGGAVWAATVHITHWNIGYIAFGIGWAVGKVVHNVAGKVRGTALQWMAAILAGLGVVAGKVGIVAWEIVDALHAKGRDVDVSRIVLVMVNNASLFLSIFDLVWIAFAVFAAWRICKPANIAIAGPYRYNPTQSASAAGLQFDTVEPIEPPGNP